MKILRSDGDIGAFGRGYGGVEAKIGGADDDFVAVVAVDQGQEVAKEVTGLVGRLVHLPVGGDEFFSHD